MGFKFNPLTGKLDVVNVPLSGAEILHSSLSGLSADDHTQYLLADGTRNLTGSVLVSGTTRVNFGGVLNYIHNSSAQNLTISAGDVVNIAEDGTIFFRVNSTAVTIGAANASTSRLFFDGNINNGIIDWVDADDAWTFKDDMKMESSEKIMFREPVNFIHSNAGSELTIQAGSVVTIGPAGNITVGSGVEASMFPETAGSMNLGTSSNKFNNIFLGGSTISANALPTADPSTAGQFYRVGSVMFISLG